MNEQNSHSENENESKIFRKFLLLIILKCDKYIYSTWFIIIYAIKVLILHYCILSDWNSVGNIIRCSTNAYIMNFLLIVLEGNMQLV